MNTLKRDILVVDHDMRHKRVVRINKKGEIVWKYDIDRALDVQSLKSGGCLINGRTDIIELDASQKEIWRYSIDKLELMSCRRLDNGNTIIGDLSTQSIYEITQNYKKVWELNYPHAEGDDFHNLFRMIRLLSNGNLLVAWHEKSKVAEFTKTGELVWEFDLEAGPYEAMELENGNCLVSVGPAGSIVEISKEKGIVWEFRTDDYPGLQKGWIAGVSVQYNGNIVFSDSKWDKLIEVNRNKEVVGIFHKPDILLHPSSVVIL